MNKLLSRFLQLFIVLLIISVPNSLLYAQELHNDIQDIWQAEVVNILEEEEEILPGTNTATLTQDLEVRILEGPKEGEIIVVENDYIKLDEGEKFFLYYLKTINGDELYTVGDFDRRSSLLWVLAIFALVIIGFGGFQGLRSLIALFGSLFIIIYFLVPGILNGFNPIILSALVAGGILFAAIFFTHGFNKESAVAFSGTILAVIITVLLSIFTVDFANLSGFSSEDTVYLNMQTAGALDFTGLLLGAIIIGVLGVLDDIAVTQAAVVTELYNSNRKLSPLSVYKKALRVGREHVGALVNTLVLAYTGTALPLLLLFYQSDESFMMIANREVFATEIVRAIIGSIGLVLTVPIVTGLAVYFLKNYTPKHSHSHSHGHSHH